MTFESVMELTRTVSSEAAFTDREGMAYYEVLTSLPKESLIVEVGLEYGRSSSIALQVAKDRDFRYVGIEPNLLTEWKTLAEKVGAKYSVWSGREGCWDPIDAILLDGDHTYWAVKADCKGLLPIVRSGGYAMFHDWPEVYPAVHEYMQDQPDWQHLRTVASLAIWRYQ